MSTHPLPITITPFASYDIPALAQYQQTMAQETESKSLSLPTITEALSHMLHNKSYGQYFIAKSEETKEPVGCTMLNYAFSVLTGRLDVWYQSVYVEPGFRKRKVFTRLFRHVEGLAGELGADMLYLYVEKENASAQAIYEKLGMNRSTQNFVEKDFCFYHEAEPIDGSNLYTIEFHTVSRDSNQSISINDLYSQIKSNNHTDLVFHTDAQNFDWLTQSLCIKVYRDEALVGLFTGFVEISDWRNGLSVYFTDYVVEADIEDCGRVVKEIEAGLTGGETLGLRTTSIRFMVGEGDGKKEGLIKAGYHLEHYYIYEKAVKKMAE